MPHFIGGEIEALRGHLIFLKYHRERKWQKAESARLLAAALLQGCLTKPEPTGVKAEIIIFFKRVKSSNST